MTSVINLNGLFLVIKNAVVVKSTPNLDEAMFHSLDWQSGEDTSDREIIEITATFMVDENEWMDLEYLEENWEMNDTLYIHTLGMEEVHEHLTFYSGDDIEIPEGLFSLAI